MSTQAETKIDRGDIVTVVHEAWELTGKQGRVVEFRDQGTDPEDPDSTIGVLFPDYYNLTYPHKGVIFFEDVDLKVNVNSEPQDITREQLLNTLFGSGMWHHHYERVTPMMIGFDECEYRGCEKTVRMRIMTNNWGTVSENDVCTEHAEWHGRNCDGFPGGHSDDSNYRQVFDRDPWTNPKEKPSDEEVVFIKHKDGITTGFHLEKPKSGETVGWHLDCISHPTEEIDHGWTRDENILGWAYIPR